MGLTGMIFGIIGLVFSLNPWIGSVGAIPCVVVGLPLSGISFYQARKAGTDPGFSIAGLATGAVALIITIFFWYILMSE